MKRNQTKTWLRVSVALLLALITLVAASCNGGGQGGSTQPPVTDPPLIGGEENPLDTIETRDFGGRDFVYVGCSHSPIWDVEEETNKFEDEIAGDPILEVGYKRSMAFEERYNCELHSQTVTPEELYSILYSTKQMNSTDYDLVDPHPTYAMASMMTSGFFTDLLTVNTINPTNEWYNQLQVENYVTNGKLYLLVSDGTINSQGFFALVYNREVLAKYQIETDIKTLVDTGRWTVDAFNDILTLTEFSGDNADGSKPYGLMFNALPDGRWIWAFGGSILDKNEDGDFIAACTGKSMLPIANALHSILNTHGNTVHIESFGNSGIPTSKLLSEFKSGKALFITFDVGGQYHYLRDLDFAKGYAPLPKLTDKQDDYYLSCASGFWAIPSSTVSFEESGLAFDFLARYSTVHLKPAFFEIILGGRLSEFPEDYEMLNLLHAKKIFDVGYTLDENEDFLHCLTPSVITNKSPDSISIYLATKGKAMKDLLAIANGIE